MKKSVISIVRSSHASIMDKCLAGHITTDISSTDDSDDGQVQTSSSRESQKRLFEEFLLFLKERAEQRKKISFQEGQPPEERTTLYGYFAAVDCDEGGRHGTRPATASEKDTKHSDYDDTRPLSSPTPKKEKRQEPKRLSKRRRSSQMMDYTDDKISSRSSTSVRRKPKQSIQSLKPKNDKDAEALTSTYAVISKEPESDKGRKPLKLEEREPEREQHNIFYRIFFGKVVYKDREEEEEEQKSIPKKGSRENKVKQKRHEDGSERSLEGSRSWFFKTPSAEEERIKEEQAREKRRRDSSRRSWFFKKVPRRIERESIAESYCSENSPRKPSEQPCGPCKNWCGKGVTNTTTREQNLIPSRREKKLIEEKWTEEEERKFQEERMKRGKSLEEKEELLRRRSSEGGKKDEDDGKKLKNDRKMNVRLFRRRNTVTKVDLDVVRDNTEDEHQRYKRSKEEKEKMRKEELERHRVVAEKRGKEFRRKSKAEAERRKREEVAKREESST